jgi:DNA-binding NarL/FixJ family response regulator
MSPRIRVTLADDHPIVLNGLRNLICAEHDLELVGEATTGALALRTIREKSPDVAVVDISMPDLNGIVLSRRVAEDIPAVRILVLTLHEDGAYLKQALDAGVRGYVLKTSAAETLIQGIRAVFVGGLYVDPIIADRVFDRNPRMRGRNSSAALANLTERETEVLKLVALGHTNKEIARRLDIGVKSVETYRARGVDKLGLKTRTELVRYASAQGWLANI